MGARIDEVDYNGFPKVATNMRSEAEKLNKEINDLYKSLAEMKKDWYGPRYDELVKNFNKMIPDLNEITKLTVTKMPFTLETIANNYAKVDIGKGITAAVETAAKKIKDVAKSAKLNLRFEEKNVKTYQSSMETNLDKVLKLMDSIEERYKQLNWKSDASDEFQKTFKKLKSNITTNITGIKKDFTRLMNEARDDMQMVENANKTNNVKK